MKTNSFMRRLSIFLVIALLMTLVPTMTLTALADPAETNYTMTFTPNADFPDWETVYVYYSPGNYMWPGVEMTKSGDQYKATISSGDMPTLFIIHNNGGSQSYDLAFNDDGSEIDVLTPTKIGVCTITSGICYDLWVGGVQVTSVNAGNILAGDAVNDGKASYDADTKTLTLSDANIDTGYQIGGQKAAVYTTDDLVLAGSGSMGGDDIGFGLYAKGEKSLTLNGDFSFQGTLNGIYTFDGNNMLVESGNVTTVGGTNGIFVSLNSSITVNGGNVTATGHGASNAYGYGVQAETLTINGGSLMATGGTSGNPGNGLGVEALTVSGGSVTAVGNSGALYAAPTLGSNVTAVASANINGTGYVTYNASQNNSYKWFRTTEAYDLWVGGVQVTSANASDVLGDGTVSYDNDTNTLSLNNYTYSGAGYNYDSINAAIFSKSNLTIDITGENSITCNEGGNGNSYAIQSLNGSLTIKGSGSLSTASADSTYTSDALMAKSNITISAEVTAVGGNAYRNNAIFSSSGIISISEGLAIYAGANESDAVWQSGTTYSGSAQYVKVTAPTTYNVTITKGSNMTKASGDETQSVDKGDSITNVVYTASGGCFPETYSVAPVNGITVTRNNAAQITVSGTPTADTNITLPGASAHSLATAVRENENPASCEESGSYDEVVYCSVCEAEISRETKTIDPLAHNWGAPSYEWSADNKSVTGKRTCGRDASHIDTETVNTTSEITKPATLTEPGEHTYTATFTKTGFTTQTKTVADIPVLVQYSITVNGGKAYSDENCTNEITQALPGTTVYLYPTPTEGKYVKNFTSEQAVFDEINVFKMPAENVVINPVYEEQAPKAFDFSGESTTIDANEFYALHYLIYGNNNELAILSGDSTFNLDIDKDGTDDLKATVTEFTPPNIPKLKIEVLATNSITEGTYTFEGLNNTPYYPASIRFVPVFTITFNANGGTVTPVSAQTDTDGKLASLPTPTRSGYNFNGWFTAASGGTKVTTETVFDADTEIFAQWTKKSSGGGGGSSAPATYTVTPVKTENGSVTTSPKNAAKGSTVKITVTPDEGYKLDKLTVTDKDGKGVEVTEKDGEYTFTMPAGKVDVTPVFVKEDSEPTTPPADPATQPVDNENPFTDVKTGDYFYDAVLWAAKENITSGTTDTTFSPNESCTRAQTVTFLWRAEGSPEPKTTINPFTDVKEGDYFYKAVLWAYENGITKGTSDTDFSPNATVTRGQTVTFLYRMKGENTNAENPFTDIKASDYYYDSVLWAYEKNITSGTSDTTFSPDDDCLRGQIVTFLYRCKNK